MNYYDELKKILEPLKIYSFSEQSLQVAELKAVASILDEIYVMLTELESEVIPTTSKSYGLCYYEDLLKIRVKKPTIQKRRGDVYQHLKLNDDCIYEYTALNEFMAYIFDEAQYAIMCYENKILYILCFYQFGKPEKYKEKEIFFKDYLPAHLEHEFVYIFLCWGDLEWRFQSFQRWEQYVTSWHILENYESIYYI